MLKMLKKTVCALLALTAITAHTLFAYKTNRKLTTREHRTISMANNNYPLLSKQCLSEEKETILAKHYQELEGLINELLITPFHDTKSNRLAGLILPKYAAYQKAKREYDAYETKTIEQGKKPLPRYTYIHSRQQVIVSKNESILLPAGRSKDGRLIYR
jgi:hypothetical protein